MLLTTIMIPFHVEMQRRLHNPSSVMTLVRVTVSPSIAALNYDEQYSQP
jgi:hypothetical protein